MHQYVQAIRVAAIAAALISLSSAADAQSAVSWKLQCQSVGNSAQEPAGDRDGHAVNVSPYSCRAEGGPMDGAVLTGVGVYEWNGTVGTGLTGHGVYRKPGALAVYQHNDFKIDLTLADGKATGFTATGRGSYKMATGSAASLAGKSYSYTARPTGPGQLTVDVKVEPD